MAKSPRRHNQWKDLNVVHFITTNTSDSYPVFNNTKFCQILWDNMFFYAKEYNIELLAFVIMPDHIHCIIYPNGDKSFSDYLRGVKSYTAKQILEQINTREPSQPQPQPNHNTHPNTKPHSRGPLTPTNRLGQGTQPIYGGYPSKRMSEQKNQIWQPEFFDYLINDVDKLEEKLFYIKNNPVKAGFVKQSNNYKWLYINPKIYEIE